jgi:hypothetical protein
MNKSRVPTLANAHGQPEYNMKQLLRNLGPAEIVPDPDKYYVFIYKAKTPNTQYDQHPFIKCTSVHRWGFCGFNYHWEDYRRYSWLEVVSNIYEIKENEVQEMMNYPIARYKST